MKGTKLEEQLQNFDENFQKTTKRNVFIIFEKQLETLYFVILHFFQFCSYN